MQWQSHQRYLFTLEEQLAQELTIASQISGFVILVLCSPESYENVRKQLSVSSLLMECGGLRMSLSPCLTLIISVLSVARRLTQKGLGDHVSARHSGIAEDSMQPLRSRSC